MKLRATLRRGTTLSALAIALLAVPAFAQDQTAQADGNDAAEAPPESAIIVTGSRAQGRTVANSPVPVDVISAEAITEGGQSEVNSILNKLVPSFNSCLSG